MSDTTWEIAPRLGYPLIQEVAPSPDGKHVVYVVREPLLADDRSEFVSHLYLAPSGTPPGTADGEPPAAVQLTFGDHRNTAPRWSPDGRYLAFLSTRAGSPNVYCLRLSGGEAWPLTHETQAGVRAPAWSPDGSRLAVLMVPTPPAGEAQAQDKARRARDDARVWGADRQYAQLCIVPFALGGREGRRPATPRPLTQGPSHVLAFDWLPDGERIAFSHRPLPEWDNWWETRLAIVAAPADLQGLQGPPPAEPPVYRPPVDLGLVGDWGAQPLASPDGRWIACHRSDRPGKWALSGRMALYPADAPPHQDVAAAEWPRMLAETPNGKCEPIGWSADGTLVYVLEQTGMTTQVWTLPASGAPGQPATTGTAVLAAPMATRQGTIFCVTQDLRRPNAVGRVDLGAGEVREVVVPALPATWPEGRLPDAEVIRWPAKDGREIEGLLVYPLGYRRGTPCPLVVEVHGGPPGAFTRGYVASPERMADTTALAARGYALLRPNPRGSTGYGRDFRFANYGDWGGGDLDDVMAGIDWLIARGIADQARLGIAGWSYGGYLTAAAIARTDRFKAACVGAGIANAISFNGTADIPAFIPDYLGTEFWDDLEPYRQRSPVLQARAIVTPTLILHGEEDQRVPVSQGHELHNALQRRGVPVELVLYPRQGHAIAEPRLMLDVRRRVVAWLERWV